MIQAIVTDIEGTTSSISFVKDVLFPYAQKHLPDFVVAHSEEAEVRELLREVGEIVGRRLPIDAAIARLQCWIDEDRKVAPLKVLQGLIWESGYAKGDFCGHVYADAVEGLYAWKKQGLRLFVYSSGSVHAQQLLFRHTEFGDLTHLFSGYFDTRTGPKQQASSYRSISEQIALESCQILFLSDVEKELDAASEAGMRTFQIVRSDTIPGSKHRTATTFSEVVLIS